ncbi:MAG: hypothetical protein GTN89_03770, partial [Acidobacteria bacterium]|nr:hypothetical protein [Acidobacteriota bacterium]
MWVVLHRVSRAAAGPVDSQITGAAGVFRLRDPMPDTGASYVVSAEFGGIAYFTNPFIWSDPPPDALETLLVYDTSSTA